MYENKNTNIDKIKNEMIHLETMASFKNDIADQSFSIETNRFTEPLFFDAWIVYWGKILEDGLYYFYYSIYNKLYDILFQKYEY
jgi:hypothetical protein